MLLVTMLTIGISFGVISFCYIKRRTQNLPDISSEIFLQRFKNTFPDVPDEMVLEERNKLASQLGIPSLKLDPSHTFDDLSKYLNFLGSYDLAIGDLENEISELFERQRVPKPYNKPANIGELIYEIIKARMIR